MSSLNSIVIKRNGAIVNTITDPAPFVGATNQTWVDNNPDIGNNMYEIYATNSHGEGGCATQSLVVGCTITTFPFFVDFEEGTNFDCWNTYNSNSSSVFQEITTGNGQYGSISNAYSGDYNYIFFSNDYAPLEAKLFTPIIKLSSLSNPVLSFYYTQESWSGDQDALSVFYRNSPTGDWTELFSNTSEVTQWTEVIIPLPNPSATYEIVFVATLDYGHGITLDDIKIDGEFIQIEDAGVIAILSPTESGQQNSTIKATLKNFGNTTITSMNVLYQINDETPISEPFSGNLEAGQTADFTFNATADFSEEGTYTLKVFTHLTNDVDNTNDTTSIIIVTEHIGIITNINTEIKVFPNPATDNIIVETIVGSTINIFDITGNLMLAKLIEDEHEIINIEHLSSGVYFISFNNQINNNTFKLIKK